MFKRKGPSPRAALKIAELKLARNEYNSACITGQITVNQNMIMPDTRLKDGVHMVRLFAGEQVARVWVEVVDKRIIKAYVL